MKLATRLYPRATEERIKWEQFGLKKFHQSKFFAVAGKNFALLQVLFLCLFSYVFGSLFQQGTHTHSITVAFVDYDNGPIGAAIRKAYSTLQEDTFPTLVERPSSDFPSPSNLETAVCATQYWAALYVLPGASNRLHDALGGGPPAQAYNSSNVITYVWNQARYSAVVDGIIASNLQTLSTAARIAYTITNGTGQIQSLLNPESLAILAQPWELTSINIQPTTQGSRAIYNTLVIILILIQEFFYLGVLNGVYASFKIYTRIHPARIIVIRNVISLSYCLVGSLCTAGAIWAFKAGWAVDNKQWALTWLTLWLFAHLNFQTLDVFTIWLPASYVPMALISWVIMNVTSILLPFELSPGFYRIGYIFPAHEVYQVLVDIWSRGCNPRLYQALPIMFAWEIVALLISVLGVYRRSHYACLAEEAQERQFNERVEAAMEFEKKREREIREGEIKEPVTDDGSRGKNVEPATRTDSNVRKELGQVIDREDRQLHQEQSRAGKTCHFGPSFNLPFDSRDSDSDDTTTR